MQKVVPPPTGWIKAIRIAIGMNLQQLGNRLSITKQSVRAIWSLDEFEQQNIEQAVQ